MTVEVGHPAFSLKVTREGEVAPIFDSSIGPLLFKDQVCDVLIRGTAVMICVMFM
jgi:hypothetical protein